MDIPQWENTEQTNKTVHSVDQGLSSANISCCPWSAYLLLLWTSLLTRRGCLSNSTPALLGPCGSHRALAWTGGCLSAASCCSWQAHSLPTARRLVSFVGKQLGEVSHFRKMFLKRWLLNLSFSAWTLWQASWLTFRSQVVPHPCTHLWYWRASRAYAHLAGHGQDSL